MSSSINCSHTIIFGLQLRFAASPSSWFGNLVDYFEIADAPGPLRVHTCHALRYLCVCTFTRTLSCQLCLAMQAMHASNGLVCPLPRAQHVAILAGRSCVPRPNSTATCWEHVCAGSIFTGANFVVSKENSPSILSNSIMVFFCWEAKKKYSGLPVCSEGFYWELFAPSKMPPSTKKKKYWELFFQKLAFINPSQ